MLKIMECFAGIGACSKALENLKIPHEIVDAVEIDKYAIKSFNAIHGTNFEPQDITAWDKDIECDLIMHGSPCQDFSLAGKQAGGDEGSGTRSSLMYETLRIVEKLKPKYVIWENVKNILSKKHIYNWECYCNRMNDLGYCNWCNVMNAKDYGVPQNRERVFTVSIRKDVSSDEFVFPKPKKLTKFLKDVIDSKVDDKYFLSEAQMQNFAKSTFRSYRLFYDIDGISPTLTTMSGGNREPRIAIKTANKKGYDMAQNGDGIDLSYPNSNTRRGRVGHGVAKTISTEALQGVLDGTKIRKLTPKECWRLMGFDDESFGKAEKVNSSTQLYKQAGNSICVPVLEGILRNLLNGENS